LWTYDAAGRKTNDVVVGVMTNRFVCNGVGDLTDLCDGQQIGTTIRARWRYESIGRMTLTAWRNTSGTVLNAHGYELDAANQRTRPTRTNIGLSHSHTLGYQYDGMGQVTHARATNNSTGLPAVSGHPKCTTSGRVKVYHPGDRPEGGCMPGIPESLPPAWPM
jgi:hypothetical protein